MRFPGLGALVSAALVVGALALGGCANRRATAPGGVGAVKPRLETRLDAGVRVGAVRGFIQTPKGGLPGTTSLGRPTLDELGVNTGVEPIADLCLAWRRHRLHLGSSYLMLHGSETLRSALVSWDVSYPAGTTLDSSSEVLSSWLGYGYALDVGRRPGVLTFTPGVGVYQYGLRYHVDGSTGGTSKRSFNSFSPMFEAGLEWYPGGRIHVTTNVRAVLDETLGLSSPTTALDASLRLHFDLWRSGGLWLETGYSRIEHYDDQTVPNDAEIELVPFFGLGGEFRF